MAMKIETIGVLEAKTHLSSLLERAARGEVFEITKHGKPLAKLGPPESRRKAPKAGFARRTFGKVADDFNAPLEDFKEYMW